MSGCLTGTGTTIILSRMSTTLVQGIFEDGPAVPALVNLPAASQPPVSSLDSAIGRVISFGEFGTELVEIEDDDLRSYPLRRYCVGPKGDFMPISMECVLDPNRHLVAMLATGDGTGWLGQTFLASIVFPRFEDLQTESYRTEANGGILSGSGHLLECKCTGLEDNERPIVNMTWRFDQRYDPVTYEAYVIGGS